MSTASKVTLASTTLAAIGTVIFVHYAQQSEKTVRGPFSPPTFHPAAHLLYS